MKGKLIAIEGIDACGKETQTALLVKKLKKEGIKTVNFSFPDYKTKSGQEIKQRLLDKKWVNSNPLKDGFPELFASNFAEKKNEIDNYLKSGTIVVCDRYEASNEAYQSAKLPEKQRANFRKYIRDLYFKKYNLPKPNIVIFLDLPPNFCEILKRNRKEQDIYEKTLPFLKKVYKRYKKMAQDKNWVSVKCYNHKKILPKEIIAKKIWEAILPLVLGIFSIQKQSQ
jgi:dTMP kinase